MKITPVTLLLFSGFFVYTASCTKEEDITQEQIIRFQNPAEETVAADNYTSLKMTVVIPANADVDKRAVTFTTDVGRFSNDSDNIVIQADKNGHADAYIHSSQPGKAKVTATVLTYSVNKQINFTAITANQSIRFDHPAQPALIADNITEKPIKVVIDKNTPVAKRKVTITTDLGTFTNGQASVDVQADQDGVAMTYLKAASPGKASLKAICNTFEAQTIVDVVAPNPGDILSFATGLPTTAIADGVSAIEIRVNINNNVQGDQRKVAFTTDLGKFPGDTPSSEVTPDATGTARILLRSNQEGTAFVTATHKGITVTKTFLLERALPDAITLTSDFTLKAGITEKTIIKSQLTKNIGKPGANFAITYTAKDTSGNNIGFFKNATLSDATGAAQVEYSAGNTTYRAPVTITATVTEKPGVTASTSIVITD